MRTGLQNAYDEKSKLKGCVNENGGLGCVSVTSSRANRFEISDKLDQLEPEPRTLHYLLSSTEKGPALELREQQTRLMLLMIEISSQISE